jgi:hypothetical protein
MRSTARLHYGNSTAYLAERLRRDRPDLCFDESVRGSVRQAAIAAGLVRVPTPLDRLISTWLAADDATRKTFMTKVTGGDHGSV